MAVQAVADLAQAAEDSIPVAATAAEVVALVLAVAAEEDLAPVAEAVAHVPAVEMEEVADHEILFPKHF